MRPITLQVHQVKSRRCLQLNRCPQRKREKKDSLSPPFHEETISSCHTHSKRRQLQQFDGCAHFWTDPISKEQTWLPAWHSELSGAFWRSGFVVHATLLSSVFPLTLSFPPHPSCYESETNKVNTHWTECDELPEQWRDWLGECSAGWETREKRGGGCLCD